MTDTRQSIESPAPGACEESEAWNVARFERWVRVGVESYVLEGAGPAAFPEAAHLILRAGTLTLGLRAFAEGLNAVRRDNLKAAVARVLSSLEPRERYVAVAEQLLAISVAISAYPVLDVLGRKIGDGLFGQPDAEGRDSLFAMTLYAVARLATPGRDDAKRCLRELIAGENFQPAHASTALIALCQVDPRGLAEHLSAPGLRDKLKRQFDLFDPDQAVRKRVARIILDIIKLENLRNALAKLDILDPVCAEPRPDDWLIESLGFVPDAPLEWVELVDGCGIRMRANPSNFIAIERGLGVMPRVPHARRGDRRPKPVSDLAETPIEVLVRDGKNMMANIFGSKRDVYADR